MSFQEINAELTQAQSELESAIRKSQAAQDGLEAAEIALVQAQSTYRKAKLEEKLYTQRMKTLQEKAWNLRKEASI